MSGKRLADIAVASGLQMATLQTQLRAVLRKIGVQRHADLVRVLSNAHNEKLRDM
jgi:DNA-binding CsgD family transcriptional regulator